MKVDNFEKQVYNVFKTPSKKVQSCWDLDRVRDFKIQIQDLAK